MKENNKNKNREALLLVAFPPCLYLVDYFVHREVCVLCERRRFYRDTLLLEVADEHVRLCNAAVFVEDGECSVVIADEDENERRELDGLLPQPVADDLNRDFLSVPGPPLH